jgi:hypothetical protein
MLVGYRQPTFHLTVHMPTCLTLLFQVPYVCAERSVEVVLLVVWPSFISRFISEIVNRSRRVADDCHVVQGNVPTQTVLCGRIVLTHAH